MKIPVRKFSETICRKFPRNPERHIASKKNALKNRILTFEETHKELRGIAERVAVQYGVDVEEMYEYAVQCFFYKQLTRIKDKSKFN